MKAYINEFVTPRKNKLHMIVTFFAYYYVLSVSRLITNQSLGFDSGPESLRLAVDMTICVHKWFCDSHSILSECMDERVRVMIFPVYRDAVCSFR